MKYLVQIHMSFIIIFFLEVIISHGIAVTVSVTHAVQQTCVTYQQIKVIMSNSYRPFTFA